MIKLPDYVNVLKSQHFELYGDDIVILCRKNGLAEKPPLYLWNLSKSCYVSSLKSINEYTFLFDVRNDKSYNLHLDSKGKITIEPLE